MVSILKSKSFVIELLDSLVRVWISLTSLVTVLPVVVGYYILFLGDKGEAFGVGFKKSRSFTLLAPGVDDWSKASKAVPGLGAMV